MLLIDGKKVSEFEKILNKFDKVVTLYAITGQGRMLKGGVRVPAKVNRLISMDFTVSDPNKGGASMRVTYDPGVIPFDQYGNIDPKYVGWIYKLKKLKTKIRKDEEPELLMALAMQKSNADNILYDGSTLTLKGKMEFRMPKKGIVAKESIDKDSLLVNALSYLIGEKKVSEKKLYDLYKFYQLDADVSENEDVEGMRVALKDIAKADPAKFIKDINDTMYDMKARVTDAFAAGILVASESRKITWGEVVSDRNHKETICAYPVGVEKEQHFTEWLVKQDKTGDVRDTMLKQLELAAVGV